MGCSWRQYGAMDFVEDSAPTVGTPDTPERDPRKGVILTWIDGGSLRSEFVDSLFNFMANDILGPQHIVGRVLPMDPT